MVKSYFCLTCSWNFKNVRFEIGTGPDVKLTTPVESQGTRQPTAPAGANQQSYSGAALHAGYSYYYPGAPGMLPVQSYYTPVIPMSGMVWDYILM